MPVPEKSTDRSHKTVRGGGNPPPAESEIALRGAQSVGSRENVGKARHESVLADAIARRHPAGMGRGRRTSRERDGRRKSRERGDRRTAVGRWYGACDLPMLHAPLPGHTCRVHHPRCRFRLRSRCQRARQKARHRMESRGTIRLNDDPRGTIGNGPVRGRSEALPAGRDLLSGGAPAHAHRRGCDVRARRPL